MAKKEIKYVIELLPSNESGAKGTFYRAGLAFSVNEPKTLVLTNEEVEVFKNDRRFKVSKASSRSVEIKASSESESVSSTEDGTTEEESTDETSTSEDTDSTSSEEDSDESTDSDEEVGEDETSTSELDDLLVESRGTLNTLAKELGIENPERKEWNKLEVAQAIVEAKATKTDSEATSK